VIEGGSALAAAAVAAATMRSLARLMEIKPFEAGWWDVRCQRDGAVGGTRDFSADESPLRLDVLERVVFP
jgi:hypothetical protein